MTKNMPKWTRRKIKRAEGLNRGLLIVETHLVLPFRLISPLPSHWWGWLGEMHLAGNLKGQRQERLFRDWTWTRKHGVCRWQSGLRIGSSNTPVEPRGDPWGAVFQCGMAIAGPWRCIDLKSLDWLALSKECGAYLSLNLTSRSSAYRITSLTTANLPWGWSRHHTPENTTYHSKKRSQESSELQKWK